MSVAGGVANPSSAMDVILLSFLRASKKLSILCVLPVYWRFGKKKTAFTRRQGQCYPTSVADSKIHVPLDSVKWIANFANTVGANDVPPKCQRLKEK